MLLEEELPYPKVVNRISNVKYDPGSSN